MQRGPRPVARAQTEAEDEIIAHKLTGPSDNGQLNKYPRDKLVYFLLRNVYSKGERRGARRENSQDDSSYYRFVEFPGDVNFSALIPPPRFRNEPSGYLNARTLDKHWCLRLTWNGLYRGVLIYSAIGKWRQRRYQKVDIKIRRAKD